MNQVDVLPDLKQIVGAMLFAAKEPLSAARIRKVFLQTAESHGGMTREYASVTEKHIKETVEALNLNLQEQKTGLHIREIANGYRLVNDPVCGPWLRSLLDRGKTNRLSRPALETLAIIAYRQPVVRSEIEAVRGVAVDQIIRNLLDMQLIRVVGRSELPGRPWLFGTTQTFLEHFGLTGLNDLPGTEELRRLEDEQLKKTDSSAKEEETVCETSEEDENRE